MQTIPVLLWSLRLCRHDGCLLPVYGSQSRELSVDGIEMHAVTDDCSASPA